MNKKTWYWIGGLVLVVIVILIIWMSAGKTNPTAGSLSGSNQLTASDARQTLHNLISSGATETCTFSIASTATSSSSSGTIFVASGNMRGDFVTTDSAGKVTKAHMIVVNGTSYIWTDEMAKGFKVSYSVVASSTAMMNRPGSIDVNQPTNYSCTGGTVDQSEFTLPTNIQFTDISGFLQAGTSASTSVSGTGSRSCGYCSSVPSAYRAQCLSALHC